MLMALVLRWSRNRVLLLTSTGVPASMVHTSDEHLQVISKIGEKNIYTNTHCIHFMKAVSVCPRRAFTKGGDAEACRFQGL